MKQERPASSLVFDWLMSGLALLLIAGLFIDGWAHSHGEVDQSFITPWHAILYGSVGRNGLVLLAAGIRGLRSGFPFARALPPGYWTSALGVVLFVVGGGFDAWWHTMFGIETDISALLSPSHLVLALAAAMIVTGPIRSIATRYGPESGGWRVVGPAVCSVLSLLLLLGFFVDYAQPIEDGFFQATLAPHGPPPVAQLYAVSPAGELARLNTNGNALWGVQVSPDGKHLTYRVNQGAGDVPPSVVEVSDITGAHAAPITHSGRHDTQPAWSNDGRWIAYISMPANTSGDFSLHIVHPDGSGDRTLVNGGTTITGPSWSPDDRSIAIDSRNGLTAEVASVDVSSGRQSWLGFTKGGSTTAWSRTGFAWIDGNGGLNVSAVDGTAAHVVAAGAGYPAWSRDGRSLVYIANDGDNQQVFVADKTGAHPRDVSQLPGLDASRASWSPNGSIYFTAQGTPSPVRSSGGQARDVVASMIEAVMIAGALLLLVHRWRAPIGSMTFVLVFFALGMAVQSDLYVAAIPALIVGILADIFVATMGDRARSGTPFAAFGFLVTALFTAGIVLAYAIAYHGAGWPADVIMGTPILAGVAGLFIAFCYDQPLAKAERAART